VERAWEQIKAAERAAKTPHGGGEDGHPGLLHGIPRSLPSLLAAEKVLARYDRTGGDLATVSAGDDDLGMALVALAARARERGESAEALVRLALARLDAAAQDEQTDRKGRSGR
jgi:XTP/dITP diphosphohydrolase